MRYLFLVVFIFVFGGCASDHQTAKGTLSYDLLAIKEEMALKLSDLVKDIRIVPLESGPDFLIPDANYLITDQYIVALNKDAMHQFDAYTGKHIRLLAVAGNGPKEFNYLSSFYAENDKLYFSMSGKDNLYVIDLNTGTHLDPYLTQYSNLRFEGINEQDELYIANDSLLFERYNFKTHQKTFLIDTLKKRVVAAENRHQVTGGLGMGGSSVVRNRDEFFYYHKSYSDTLYRQTSQGVDPYICLRLPSDQITSTTTQGLPNGKQFTLKVPYVDSYRVFSSVLAWDIKSSENHITASIVPQGLYCIDRKTGDAKVVTRYLFDPLFEHEFINDENIEENSTILSSVMFGFNNYVVDKKVYAKAIAAYEVKEYIQASLENPNFPDNKKQQLRELDAQLSEEGNPVLFIGNKI